MILLHRSETPKISFKVAIFGCLRFSYWHKPAPYLHLASLPLSFISSHQDSLQIPFNFLVPPPALGGPHTFSPVLTGFFHVWPLSQPCWSYAGLTLLSDWWRREINERKWPLCVPPSISSPVTSSWWHFKETECGILSSGNQVSPKSGKRRWPKQRYLCGMLCISLMTHEDTHIEW